jgi:hypothetical protein
MLTYNSFDLLSISHEIVLSTDAEILQIMSVEQGKNNIRIGYSTEENPIQRILVDTAKFNNAKPSIQVYSTQKGIYKRHLIISKNMAQSLTLSPKPKKDYITIDVDFKSSVTTYEDYRQLLISLNTWRYREPIVKKALTISPHVYDVVSTFQTSFYQYFNTKYYREVVVNLAKQFKTAHNDILEESLLESLKYLKHNERKLSFLQVEKIQQCLIFILKNWVICEHELFNKALIQECIKVLNSTQKIPHLTYDVGFSTLAHYLRLYS